MSSEPSLELLNIYEIDEDGQTRYLVCFLEPVMAGAKGIDGRSVVGEFEPLPDGEFNPHTFQLNPEFVASLTDYMNADAIQAEELQRQAQESPSGWLYLIDPRHQEPSAEPPAGDVLGAFAVDDAGQVVPNSFQYNSHHLMFDPEKGPSALLMDRRFYDWLHPVD